MGKDFNNKQDKEVDKNIVYNLEEDVQKLQDIGKIEHFENKNQVIVDSIDLDP